MVLKLDDEILLNVPRMVSLPSLKTLELHEVKYSKDETLQRLLSNCTILEDLVVYLRERDTTTRNLTVVVPSLQRLTLYIPNNYELYEYVIDTPSLKYFELVDYNDYDHYGLIENMPYLIEAYVDSSCPGIYSLIYSVTSVKRLTICSVVNHFFIYQLILCNKLSVTLLSSAQAILNCLVFNELEHLEVFLCTVLFSNQLVRLLKACSNLKRLDISLMDVSLFVNSLFSTV